MSDSRRIELLEQSQVRMEQTLKEQYAVLIKLQTIITYNTEILEEHQRRSEASEARLDIVERNEAQFKSFIKGVAWVFGGLGSLLGLLWLSINLLERIIK